MAVTKTTYYQPDSWNNIPYSARPFNQGPSFYVPAPYAPPDAYVPPPNYIKDYADPTALNSVLDVLLNEAALDKMSAKDAQAPLPFGLDTAYNTVLDWVQKQDAKGTLFGDLAQKAFGAVHLWRTSSYDPIAGEFINPENRGLAKLSGFGSATMNLLQNFGETMDVAANVVKGMILEKDGWAKGLERSLGTGPEGRYNYDYDTGSKLLDIGLEVISDPLNYISFGTWAIGKLGVSAGTTAVKAAVKASAKELGEELAEEGAEYLTRQVLKQVRRNPDELVDAFDKALTAAGKTSITHKAIELANDADFVKVFQKNMTAAVQESMNVGVLSGLRQLANAGNAIESVLMKSVGWTSGVIPGWRLIRLAADPIAQVVHVAGRETLKGAPMPAGYVPLTQFEPTVNKLKDALTGMPDDQIDDYARNMIDSIKAQAIDADNAKLYEIVRKSKNVPKELDAYFSKAAGLNFKDYVDYLRGLSERLPEFEYHYQNLSSIQELVENIAMRKQTQDALARLRKIRTTVEMAFDGATNMMRGASFDPLKLSELTRQLQELTATIATQGVGSNRLANLLVLMRDAYYRSAVIGRWDQSLNLDTPEIRQLLTEELGRLKTEADKLSDTLKESARAAKDAIKDTAYLRHLEAAVEAGADAPFDELVKRLDTTAYEELRGKVNPVFIAERQHAVLEAYNAVRDFFEKYGVKVQDLDYFKRQLDRAYSAFRHDPEIETLELHRFLEAHIRQLIARYSDKFGYTPFHMAKETVDDGSIIDLIRNLEGMRDALAPLSDQLDTVRTYDLLTKVTEYSFKESQAYAMLQLLDTEAAAHLHDFSQQIVQRTGVGLQVDQLKSIPGLAPLVANIQGKARAHLAFTDLLARLEKDEALQPLLPNIFDTLQNYKLIEIDRLMNNRDGFLTQFVEKLQTQLNAIEAQRNSLDWIFEGADKAQFKQGFEEYLRSFGLTSHAHDAQYDLLKTMYLFTLPEFLNPVLRQVDLDRFIPVFYDIETTGLKAGSDRILQIAWRSLDGQTNNIRMQLPEGMYPSHDVIQKLTGGAGIDEFDKLYRAADLPEQQAGVRRFMEDMQQLEAAANPAGTTQVKKVMLVGWNNSRFDDSFIRDALHSGYPRVDTRHINYFDGLQTLDGLAELNRIQGVTQLTRQQTKSLKQHLMAYMNNRHVVEGDWNGPRHFIDTLDGGFAKDIQKLDRQLKQMVNDAPISGRIGVSPEQLDLARMLQNIGREIDGGWVDLNKAADELYTALDHIESDNRILLGKRIYKDNVTKAFYDLNGHEIQIPGVLNTSQFMASQAGTLMQGAVKVQYNADILQRVFEKLPANTTVSQIVRDQYYNFAENVVRLSDSLRNTDLARMHYDSFATAAEQLKQLILEWSAKDGLAVPAYLKQLDPAVTGTFDRYAIAKQLFDQAKYLANTRGHSIEFKELLKQKPLEQAYRLLTMPGIMFSRYASASPMDEFTSSFWNLKRGELWTRGREYTRALLDDADDTGKSLKERLDQMGLIRDRKHMGNASSQAGYAVLKKYQAAWQRAMNYIWSQAKSADELQKVAAEAEHRMLNYINSLSLSNMEWLAKLEPEKLEKYLWLANGRVTIGTPASVSEEYAVFMKGLFDTFIKKAPELKRANIKVYFDEGSQRLWLWLDNDKAVVQKWKGAELDFLRAEYDRVRSVNKSARRAADKTRSTDWYAELYEDLQPYFRADASTPAELVKAYEEARDLTSDLTRGKNLGTLGDMISRESMQDIDNFAPLAIRNQFIPLDVFGETGHFDSFQFNRSNLGLPSARRQIAPYASGNIIKGYMNSAQSLMDVMDARTKMSYLFFDQTHALSSKFYESLTNEDLFEMLKKHPELKVAGLVEDAKYGVMVQEFSIWNIEDLAYFRARPDLNVTIMPVHTFIQAHQAINDFKVGGSFLQALNHWVIGPMKTGYLTSLGFVFRNLVDSMVKNLVLAQDPEESINMIRHTFETAKYYQRYHQIFKEMQTYSDDVVQNAHGMFSKRVLARMYEVHGERLNKLMSQELFQLYHDFIEQGPSAGLSGLQRQAIDLKMKKNLQRLGLPEPKRDLAQRLMDNRITQGVLSANSDLEQIMRLSGYTWALEQGETTDAAMHAVLKHHFDYTTKSKAEMYADYVVPFSSFTLHNTKFWLDSLDKYGWLASMYRDFYTPFWDFDQRDNEELNRNRSIQYHILAGNLIFDDSNLVLKLSPSVLDAVRLLSDPEEALGRVVAYLRIPVELLLNGTEDMSARDWIKLVLTNLPMIGPMLYRWWPEDGSVAKAADRIRKDDRLSQLAVHLLPSIFGAVARFERREYDYDSYRKPYVRNWASKYYPTGTFTRRPKNIRRTWARKTYARKKYARKTYARKSYARRGYFRGTYASRSFFTGTYVPRGQRTSQVMATVLRTARGRPMRMPGAGTTLRNPTPGIYRKIYTGTGRSRFLSRMVPVTAQNLAARLRSDWAYLR